MSTPGYPDFTNPVAQAETDTVLLPSTAVPDAFTEGPFDTSQAESVTLTVASNAASPAGNRVVIILTWDTGAGDLLTQTLTMNRNADYQDLRVRTAWQLPVRGRAVGISAQSADGRSQTMTLVSSTRPISAPLVCGTAQANQGGMLLVTGSISVPASSSQTFYVPPVTRAVNIRMNASVALAQINLNAVGKSGGALAALDFGRIVGNSAVQQINNMVIPFTGLEVQLQNTDTVAHPMGCTVWDVS